MRLTLTDYVGSVLDAPISKLRRYAIAIAICAACAIGAIYYGASAAAIALEPQVGAAYAHLIVAGAFLLLAAIAIVAPRFARNESMIARAQAESKGMSRDMQLAMILEAMLLGFSASSGKRTQGSSK